MSPPLVDAARVVLVVLHGIGWSLVYALVVGTLLGSALWVLLALLDRRTAWARYALCCGAVVIMVGVPVQAGVAVRSAYSGHGALAAHYAQELMEAGSPAPDGPLPGGWSAQRLSRAVEARHDHGVAPWLSGRVGVGLGTALAVLSAAWLFGVALRLVRLATALRVVRRLRRDGVVAADARWERLLDETRGRLDVWHPVRLGVTARVDAPVLIGWWRPTILLPPGPHTRLSDAETEAVLAHELAHIRRGDYAVNLIQAVAEALLFFHPVMWWLGERLRDEREYCSDDLAQRSIRGSLAEYLRALAKLEAMRGTPAPEPAVAADGRSLLRRIRRLVELSRRARRPRGDLDLLLVAACLVGLWAPTVEATRTAHHAAIAVMKHELRLARDYAAIADAVPSERPAASAASEEARDG